MIVPSKTGSNSFLYLCGPSSWFSVLNPPLFFPHGLTLRAYGMFPLTERTIDWLKNFFIYIYIYICFFQKKADKVSCQLTWLSVNPMSPDMKKMWYWCEITGTLAMAAVTRTSRSLMTFPVAVCYNDSVVPLVIISSKRKPLEVLQLIVFKINDCCSTLFV